jgi:hypothetical protein
MPLFEGALEIIRTNLEEIAAARRPRRVTIGELSPEHLEQINACREENELPPISGEIVFIGRHLYESRIVNNGYSIDDVLEQIESACNRARSFA